MRIVAVADTHTFEDDLGEIPAGDVFVHAGDMTRGGTPEELSAAAAWIAGLPHRHKIIVAGNHDWGFAKDRKRSVELFAECHYLEDSAIVIDGVKFWGSPWQPEFHSWAFNLPRGPALAEKWDLIAADTDVLVTHGPPAGYGDNIDFNRASRSGCVDLLAAVRRIKPRLHMYGHIHQDGGMWREDLVVFANVTTWECERAPSVFDVDPQTKEVVAVSIPPARNR